MPGSIARVVARSAFVHDTWQPIRGPAVPATDAVQNHPKVERYAH